MRIVRKIAWELWLPVVLIAAWWIASAGSTSFYFPPLSTIVEAFRDDWLFERIGTDLVPSLQRLFSGYLIAVVAGVVLGLVLGIVKPLEVAFSPITEFFRAMPSVAKLPLLVLLFGLDNDMKIAIIAIVGFFPVLLNTIDGVQSLDPQLRQVASAYRLSLRDRIFRVYMPAAMPQVFAGARIALSLSVIAMVLAEMVGSPGGIGYFVLDAQRSFAIPSMWSGILALGILGYVLNKLFLLLEGRVLSWHRGMTSQQG